MGRGEYERLVGNRLMTGTCAATSVLWLRDERPDAYAAAETIGFANTFVTRRLTGRFCADPSHLALSGLADVRNPRAWDETLCERLGVDPGRLPAIAG